MLPAASLLLFAACTSSAVGQSGASTPAKQPTSQQDQAASAAAAVTAAKNQMLIDQAERNYRTGVENYRTGHLDAARQDFDSAVDLMLASGLDLKNDAQLADEFEHLVDAVNALEMDALKQGNGLSPKVEAAPLENANEVTFKSDPKLTAALTAELKTTKSDFPLVINDYVAGFINYFTNSQAGHAHLQRSLERAGKYKDMILKVLSDEGVPQDLIYQAVAESGFQPQAMNARSGAGGMWQFMPTGAYGLQRNGWFDERFDPEKSSHAYARYMKGLYDQFGDWYLAMAAYDWGPGNVQRAVMKTGYADFWELYRRNVLPGETKNYVPGILAAIIMAKNPKKYGLDSLVPDSPVISDTVSIDYALDLRLAAELAGCSIYEIVALNPALLRLTTPRDIEYDLHLPPGTKDLFNKRIAAVPEARRATWRFHVVQPGETIEGIADGFHIKPHDLAQANGMELSRALVSGNELVVPIAPEAATTSLKTQHYTVRHGDTLITVADRFGVTVAQLQLWNGLKTNTIPAGKVMVVSQPIHLAPATRVRPKSTAKRKPSSTTTAKKPVTTGETKSKPATAKSGTTAATKKPSHPTVATKKPAP